MPSLLDPGVATYVALAVALVTWLLLFAYIWRLDAQSQELRRRLDAGAGEPQQAPQVTLEAQRQRLARGGQEGDGVERSTNAANGVAQADV
jgi:CcmD family protein